MSVVLTGTECLYCTYNGHSLNYPFSFSAWFKYGSEKTASETIVSLDANTNTVMNLALVRGAVAGDPGAVGTYASVGGWGFANSANTSAGSWYHILVVFAAANSRSAYINGGSKATDTTNLAAAGCNNLSIGARYGAPGGSAADLIFTGNIAEVAIWHSALSDANAVSLAALTSPLTIDAANLDEYWSLLGDANTDMESGGTNLSNVNSPSFDAGTHPSAGGGGGSGRLVNGGLVNSGLVCGGLIG